jgi:hypothetical protein
MLMVDSLHHILCPLAIVLGVFNVGMFGISVVVYTHFHVADFIILADVFLLFSFSLLVSVVSIEQMNRC